jgi:PAS domain S-box-containing protein
MNLRQKTFLFIFCALVFLFIVFFLLIREVIGDSFQKIEYSNTKLNLLRVKEAINDNLKNLNTTAKDWSDWDDTYNYLKGGCPDYLKKNLIEKTYIDLNLNFIILINIYGEILYSSGFNLKEQKFDPIPHELNKIEYWENNLFFSKSIKNPFIGIISKGKQPFLFTARPVLNSFARGNPSGTLIMGRYLDAMEITKLRNITRLPLEIEIINRENNSQSKISDTLSVAYLNADIIRGEYYLPDIHGQRNIKININQERNINHEWQTTLKYFTFYFLLTGLIFGLIMLIFIEKVVLKKIKKLNSAVSLIGEDNYNLKDITISGKDEIAALVANIKKMLSLLENSQKKFKGLVEQSLVGIYIIKNYKMIYVNPKVEEISGYTSSELLEFDGILDIIHKDDVDFLKKNIYDLEAGNSSGLSDIARVIRKDNKIIFVELFGTAMTVNNEVFVIGVFLDITERKKIEKSLLESEKQYRTIVENTGTSTIIIEDDLTISLINVEFEKLSGYKREEIERKMNLNKFFSEEDSEKMRKYHEMRKFNQNSAPRQYSCTFIDKNGKEHEVLNTVALITESNKSIVSLLDITEIKQISQALIQSEERYKRMTESIQDGLTLIENGRIVYVNSHLSRITGYSREEILSMNFEDFIIPEERERYNIIVKDSIKNSKLPPEFESEIIRKDGTQRYIRNRYSFDKTGGNVLGLFIITTDITEKIKMDERLRKTEALESLGNLAGGVAHDLNNKLGPMVGYPDILLIHIKRIIEKNKIPQSEFLKLEKGINTMKKAAQESADEVQDLLTLARRIQYSLIPTDLNDIVKSIVESPAFLIRKQKNENIVLNIDLKPELMNIKGSETHLNKVMMNIIMNAFDAMPNGGKLSIITDNEYIDKPINAYDDLIPVNEYVTLVIEDTGSGIKPEYLQKIFEPFFTKKTMKQGSGTGLGLAIVYGIVKDHNGFITLKSEYGIGTSFKLYFPATREKIKTTQDLDEIPGGNEFILIVDDDESQREIASQILQTLGYKTHAVKNGRESLTFLADNRADLVLLDMIMEEDFDGLVTYSEILKIRPDQKSVIVSGFSENTRVKEAQKLGVGAFLRKPYTMEKIALVIRSVLDKNS